MKEDKNEAVNSHIEELLSRTEALISAVSSPTKRLLSIAEAAEYLCIGKTEAYIHLRKHVRAINHGKKILIPKEELDNLIERAKRTGILFS